MDSWGAKIIDKKRRKGPLPQPLPEREGSA